MGIIPSPYDVDPEWKLRSKRAVKAYERSERESLVRKLLLELESFATRCEARLPYDRERCIIKEGFSRDVTNIGHWGCGAVELYLQNSTDFEKAKPLIDRAYDEN